MSTRSSGFKPYTSGGSTTKNMLFVPDSKWQWLFVGILLAQAISVLALEGWALAAFESSLGPEAYDSNYQGPPIRNDEGDLVTDLRPYARSLPTFLALYIFGMIYELGLAWDALRLKNTIQIIGIGVYNLGLMLYGAVQRVQIVDTIKVVSNALKDEVQVGDLMNHLGNIVIAVPCILAVGSIALLYVGYKLYGEFAWTIYKHVSADLQLRKRYMIFEIYIVLLKFDFFFALAFTMEFLVLLATYKDGEFYITIIAIPLTILILLGAAIIVRRENKALMWLILLFYIAGMGYFFFKLIRIWAPGEHKLLYEPGAKPLTIFAVFTILLLAATIGIAYKCMMNFGHGLKPYVNSGKVESEENKMYMNDLPNINHPANLGADIPGRMVIE